MTLKSPHENKLESRDWRIKGHSFIPSKRETLNQYWFNVWPSSQTVAQHQTNIGSTSVFADLMIVTVLFVLRV